MGAMPASYLTVFQRVSFGPSPAMSKGPLSNYLFSG